jgi:hypothetical protein
MIRIPLHMVAVLWCCWALGLQSACQPSGRQSTQDDFEQVAFQVLEAFRNKDTVAIQSLVAADQGVYLLFRAGVFDEYTKMGSLDWENVYLRAVLSYELTDDFTLRYESLPAFDCDSLLWSKQGFYCDTTAVDRLLSTTTRNLVTYREDPIKPKTIEALAATEKSARRLVWASKKGHSLVFYLIKHQQKWYLWMIDTVTTDCSA